MYVPHRLPVDGMREIPSTLKRTVDQYLDDAHLPELNGDVMGVIAPHAGHLYSGEVAGYAFAAFRGLRPDLVVVAGPMHHPYTQPLITTMHAAYSTPLGDIPVDKNALNELDVLTKAELGFGLTPIAKDPEHSLEIELPFFAAYLPTRMEASAHHGTRPRRESF